MNEARIPKLVLDMAIKHYKTELEVLRHGIFLALLEAELVTFDPDTQPVLVFELGYPHDDEGGWYGMNFDPYTPFEEGDELDQLTLIAKVAEGPLDIDAAMLNHIAKAMREKNPLGCATAVYFHMWGWYT